MTVADMPAAVLKHVRRVGPMLLRVDPTRRRIRSAFAAVAAMVSICVGVSGVSVAAEDDADVVSFVRDIQPIFAEKCLLCHGADDQEAGLRLDSFEAATATLESDERAIVPGDVDASELIRRITTDEEDERMPPEGDPLSKEQIEKLRDWITAGAKYETHWSYRPLRVNDPPKVKDPSRVHNDVDRYVVARLEEQNIAPSREANRTTLIKRLYYDLVGLLPRPKEVDDFVDDKSPDAYEKLVDRLLASRHFGERWGRHWLDKARYADSDGYEKDSIRPNAWRYRDWVIDAVNADMPLDQFAIEQLAGDLLPDAKPEQRLATAFHRQTLTNREGGVDQEEFRVAAVHDRTETVGTIWMALTVGCARCHSHKYDQITQREYYQLFAFFNNGDETNTSVPKSSSQLAQYNETKKRYDVNLAKLEAELKSAKGDAASRLQKEIKLVRAAAPKPPTMSVRVIAQRKNPRKSHVFDRGDFLQPKEEVQPGTVATLTPLSGREPKRPADRLDLARWLVSSENPLPPRVLANQIFGHLFGRGLVRTMDDFGVRGEPPTHPALLDHLASELIRHKWSRKALIKYIVMSATYQQSSNHRPKLVSVDPLNDLLYRQNRLRVEGELVRDLSLAASGLLSSKVGGPSVFPPLPKGVAAFSYANNFKWKESKGEDRYRRGMYTFFKRTSPHPDLLNFDCPDSNRTNVRRNRSNTPLQALQTLNNKTHHEASQALAKRVLDEEHVDDRARIAAAFRYCLLRTPTKPEVDELELLLLEGRKYYVTNAKAAADLIGTYAAKDVDPRDCAAWVATLRILLSTDEFLTRE